MKGKKVEQVPPASDMAAIFEMVEREQEIQDTMDQAKLILSSGDNMNDNQEKKLVLEDFPEDGNHVPALLSFREQQEAIRQEIDKVKKLKEELRKKRLIRQAEDLAKYSGFQLQIDLTQLTSGQLIILNEELANLKEVRSEL